MMGCFSASATRVEKQRSSSVPRSVPQQLRSVIASKDSLTLLANKPVELPDPRRFGEARTTTQILRRVDEGRTAFSGPMVGGKAGPAAGYESSFESGRSGGMRTLRRTTSFGGRPQPLPLPVAEGKEVVVKEVVQRSRRIRSFTLEETTPGSRSARRGRVAPLVVGGMPLPPPALAGKSFTAADLGNFAATPRHFAATPRVADVHGARVRNVSHDKRSGMAVFRLAENAAHVR